MSTRATTRSRLISTSASPTTGITGTCRPGRYKTSAANWNGRPPDQSISPPAARPARRRGPRPDDDVFPEMLRTALTCLEHDHVGLADCSALTLSEIHCHPHSMTCVSHTGAVQGISPRPALRYRKRRERCMRSHMDPHPNPL